MGGGFPKPKGCKIFVDFDGTIATVDVCNEIFKKFGNFQPFFDLLVRGEISLKCYWIELFKSLPKGITLEEIETFVENEIVIDTTFLNFVDYCKNNNLPLIVVSDGFDFYIRTVFRKYGLSNLKFFANSVQVASQGIEPVFTYASESCRCNAGSCKRNIILSQLAEDEALVYIGDGYSDFCMTEYSDIIFASKVLKKYCSKHRITHFPFENFSQIIEKLEDLFAKKQIRFRRKAYLERKKAFEIE